MNAIGGGALVAPTSAALAIQLVSDESRARALAIVFSGFTLASVAGVPLGTWLGLLVGWRGSFLAVAVLGALAFLVAVITFRSLSSFTSSIGNDTTTTHTASSSVLISTLFTTVAVLGAQFVIYALMATFLIQGFGLPEETLPLALLAFGVAGVVGNAIAGAAADRFGPGAVVWLSLCGLGIMFLWFLIEPNAIAAVITLAGCALFGTLFTAPQQARLTRLSSAKHHGIMLGFNVPAGYVGIAIGSSFASELYDQSGVHALPLGALAVVAIAAVLNLFVSVAMKSQTRGTQQ